MWSEVLNAEWDGGGEGRGDLKRARGSIPSRWRIYSNDPNWARDEVGVGHGGWYENCSHIKDETYRDDQRTLEKSSPNQRR